MPVPHPRNVIGQQLVSGHPSSPPWQQREQRQKARTGRRLVVGMGSVLAGIVLRVVHARRAGVPRPSGQTGALRLRH